MTAICYPTQQALLSPAEALKKILAGLQPLNRSETLPLLAAQGRILAAPIYATTAIPATPVAAMDGYGLSSEHIRHEGFRLSVAGRSIAGHPYQSAIPADSCIRILTGAVVPQGVDSVIAQEQTHADAEWIDFAAGCEPYRNIRAAGSDVEPGQCLMTQGQTLTPVAIGLLAAAGIDQVTVYDRLRVAYFSTGDELKPLGQPLAYGDIYDSNRHQLHALLHDPRIQLTDLGIVNDDPALLEQWLREYSAHHDVLISSGGASVGDADYIQSCLANCGEVAVWKIAIKPGKPLTFGRIGECVFFGLPGNPIAVWVSVETFVRPALQRLSGGPSQQHLRLQATCLSPLRKKPGREDYQRGILQQANDGTLTVMPVSGQDSHQLASASQANCFIILPLANAGVNAGEMVSVEPFSVRL